MQLEPMLCSHSSAASGRRGVDYASLIAKGGWVGDVKIDGVRAIARWTHASGLTLTNRNGAPINRRFPEVVKALTGVLMDHDGPIVLDGEIVAMDGSFESTLTRDKQVDERAISRLVEEMPVMFIAFDMPDLGKPAKDWTQRRADLDAFALDWKDARFAKHLHTSVTSTSPDFLQYTRNAGMEGVVAKRVNSRYEFGRRSKNWIKFRNRYRVTCLATGYTPGTGSRAHFGAMTLQLLGEGGQLVDVGRVGTGFTAHEIDDLKSLLDEYGVLPVEIECANLTRERTLRFPVYKGIRSDIDLKEVTADQLEHLPVC